MAGSTKRQLFRIQPFGASFTGGVFIAAGDINGDGFAGLYAGGGPGGGPRVLAGDGRGPPLNGPASPVTLANFFAGNVGNRGGIRLAIKDIDGDKQADLITGAGDNAGSEVNWFRSLDLLESANPAAARRFNAFDDVLNGVFVG